MLTINDFQRRSAQEYGRDTLDAIDSKDSVYLVPEQPVEDLPELRIRIWPQSSANRNHAIWTWNWRTVHPGPEMASPDDGPQIRLQFVGGRTGHDTLHSSIGEAAEAAISSINDYLEKELPEERRMKEEQAWTEQEWKDRIQEQVNDFLEK